MKRLLLVSALFFSLGLTLFLPLSRYPRDAVKVSFLSVGQGDAILIVTPDKKTLLIDGGPDNSLLEELGTVLPWWQRHLDFVLLTHEHSDHLLGLLELGDRYRIKQVFYGEVTENNILIKEWFSNLEKNKIPKQKITAADSFSLGKYCQVNILSAAASKEINDQSVVSELVCGQRQFLFTGDAGQEIEADLLDSGLKTYDVLKVSHHGAASASQEIFLRTVKPLVAIISVGKDNKFSHPHLETLKRLETVAANIFRTDEVGTINIFANNKDIYLKKAP
ncbi:MAG: MBL fold metallo-hydrolase [Candidatus Parcubacteria bacterium]|jgi:competence protein ComEC|nr:MAG: hypothetical protein JST_5880 [Candidatus Parcubacteria bacterium]